MWYFKIKTKKKKFILIAIIMMIVSMIFSSCIGLVISVRSYVTEYYSNEKNADIFVNTYIPTVKGKVEEIGAKNKDINKTKSLEGFYINKTIEINDESIDPNFIYILPVKDYNDFMWDMNIKDGNNKAISPKSGTIWVSSVFADLYDTKVGDEITFTDTEGKSYEISAIVNNAIVPSATLGYDYLFVNEEDLQNFNKYIPEYLTTIKVNNSDNFDAVYDDVVDEIGQEVGGVIMTKPLLINVATLISNILGGISIFAALVILIGAIFIVRFILKSELNQELNAIGIYKAVGFLSNEIRSIYVKAFGIVVSVGVILGYIISIPIINRISKEVLEFIGEYRPNTTDFMIIGLITFVLLTTIVLLSLAICSKSIKKMSPLEALNSNDEGSNTTSNTRVINNAFSSFSVAINDIVQHKKSSAMLLIILTISFYLLILFVNINSSIEGIRENSNVWFGTPKCTATISGNFEKYGNEIESYLDGLGYIDNFTTGDLIVPSGVSMDTQKYSLSNTNIGAMVFDEYSDSFDFVVSEGRNPIKDNEVAINKTILNESNLNIDDNIELIINGDKKNFKIVGSYRSLLNLGYNFRILSSNLNVEQSDYVYGKIFVTLKDKEEFDEFKELIEDKYYGASVENIIPDIKNTLLSIESIVYPVIVILVTAFIIFALINIFNLIISNTQVNKRNHGILKSFGFTTGYICSKYLVKISVLSLVGILLAITIHLNLSKEMFSLVLGGIDGLNFYGKETIQIISIVSILIILVTALSCLPIKSISPKELTEK